MKKRKAPKRTAGHNAVRTSESAITAPPASFQLIDAIIGHSLPESKLLEALGSSQHGLSSSQASSNLGKFGPNEIRLKQSHGAIEIFVRQFKNMLILLLLGSAAVAYLVNDIVDAIGILVAVVLSVFFGFVQEYKAEQALSALRKLAAPHAIVLRDGKENEILSSGVVPGDILVLSEGDLVSADCRLIDSTNLASDQSVLTGESVPASKLAGTLAKNTPVAERSNVLFSGTTVVRGHGNAVVFACGLSSEFGRIASRLASVEDQPTPLQQNLASLGENIGKITLALCFIFFIFGVWRGEAWSKMLIVAISLAVAAIPEGLPTVLAITMAIGVQRMAERNAIVRKLPAVETLGSATVICTDKTGTLTANRMTLTTVHTQGRLFSLEGGPLDAKGAAWEQAGFGSQKKTPSESSLGALGFLLRCASLCANASFSIGPSGNVEGVRGDPTEVALLVGAQKAGISPAVLRTSHPKVSEISFEYSRKMMTQVRQDGKAMRAFSKGAPERILSLCTRILTPSGVKPLPEAERKRILSISRQFGEGALRTLGVAYRDLPPVSDARLSSSYYIERDFVWVGLAGLIDPPRPEVAGAIADCQAAGIRIIMITGDSPSTAKIIAGRLGLLTGGGRIMLGDEIEGMGEGEQCLAVRHLAVCARATPEHKYKIVSALKKNGEIVAVTGDGVNDAPSIKAAQIGIAMGVGGSDVARGASDIILTDNNFNTISVAIRQGRSIYENIRSFVRFQFATNVAALTLMFSAPLLLLPLPLTPLQILWVNIIMDGPPALALGVEPSRSDTMKRPPRKPDAPFISRTLLGSILLSGFVMFALTLAIFALYSQSSSARLASTMAFTAFIVLQLVNAYNCRSPTRSAFADLISNRALAAAVLLSFVLHLAIIYHPALQALFGTVPLGANEWAVAIGAGLALLALEEIRKRFFPSLTQY